MYKNRLVRGGVGILLVVSMLLSTLVPTIALSSAVSASGKTQYSRTITVNAGQVPSTQTDFPLLVSLSDGSLKTLEYSGHVADDNGGDIYFTDSTGSTRYPFEIEKYDGATGTLVAWVKVPSLSDGTVLKMWYGGSSITDNDPADVWDDTFKGVWHMDQANPPDSTSYGNNGTIVNGEINPGVTGKIGKANEFNGMSTPTSGYVDCGTQESLNFSATGSYTWQAWIYATNTAAGGSGIIGKNAGSSTESSGYDVYLKNGYPLAIQNRPAKIQVASVEPTPTPNEWHQVSVTYDNQQVALYLDGALNNGGTLTGTVDDTLSHMFIGFRASHNNGTGIFNGTIDEVRYMTAVRSPDWITTEFNNQNNPASFYTVGVEEELTVPPSVTTHPAGRTVSTGDTASFTAAASGIPAPTVQWQVSVDSGTNWNDISGAIENTLTLEVVTAEQNGSQYHAVFTNVAGNATSNPATLTVSSVTWYVDDSGGADFTTIQEAVTAASAVDTIVVRDGTYNENIIINNFTDPFDSLSGEHDRTGLILRAEHQHQAIVNNVAEGGDGIAFKITSGNVTIDGFYITNSATLHNGSLGIDLGGPYTYITNNNITDFYKGIYFHNSADEGYNVISRNVITTNGPEGYVTAIGIDTYKIQHSQITDNSISYGSTTAPGSGSYGMYIRTGARYNTISGNTVTGFYNGIYLQGVQYNTFVNNTLSHNQYAIWGRGAGSNGGSLQYNRLYLNSSIENQLGDVNILTQQGPNSPNYWFSESPITYTYQGASYTSYLGNYWDRYEEADADGDGIGDTSFITSAEYLETDDYPLMFSPALAADFTSDVQSGGTPLTVHFTDRSTGIGNLTYAWDFDNDGTVDSTEQNPTYVYNTPGPYSVKLTVTGADTSNSITKSGYILISGNFLYVGPAETYTTIQTAVGAATAYDTIIVRDGTYNENIVINNYADPFDSLSGEHDRTGLILRAENQRQAVVNNTAEGSAGIAFKLQADQVTIDGFNIINSAAYHSSSKGVYGSGNFVFNHTITNNIINNFYCGIVVGDTVGGDGYNNISGNDITTQGATGFVSPKGIFISRISRNTINNNTCTNIITGAPNLSADCGAIYIGTGSNHNSVAGNTCSGYNAGVYFKGVQYNTVFSNVFEDNDNAIHIRGSGTGPGANNIFYSNSIIGNTVDVYIETNQGPNSNFYNSDSEMSYLYNGTQNNSLLGNYWDRYEGVDADDNGIGDTPFVTNTTYNELDNYPLVFSTALKADFTSDIQTGNAPLTVHFTDRSTGIGNLTYAWDFDNNGTVDSTAQNPSFTYVAPFTYTVKLTVTSADGSNTVTRTDYVVVGTPGYTITASAGAHGSISPSGSITVNMGESKTFTFTPDAGYHVKDVLVDGVSVGAVTEYTFADIQQSHTIAVSFSDTYTIIASATATPAGNMAFIGWITPSGHVAVNPGADRTFNITVYTNSPDSGHETYHIADVLVDSISVGAVTSYTFEDVQADHTIEVRFAINTFIVTAEAGPGGTLNFIGTMTVESGTQHGFTATADPGYRIAQITDNAYNFIHSWPDNRAYEFNFGIEVVNEDHLVTATFEPDTFTVFASAGANGSISPSGHIEVDSLDDQTFTITPAAGFHVEDVLVDHASVGAVASYTFSGVATTHTISATFAADAEVPTADFTSDVQSGRASLTVNFSDQSGGIPNSWAWDFDNNGTVDSSEQSPSHVYDTPGVYSVKLTVMNANGSNSITKTSYIFVSGNILYVGPAETYTTIQAAVDAAAAYDSIVVRDGTYTTDQNINVNTTLTIRSENGRENVTISSTNYSGTIFEVRAPYVTVDGFTLEGTEDTSSGISLILAAEHCTIINNDIRDVNTGVIFYNNSGNAVFGDNIVRNNFITPKSYHGIGIKLENSSNNSITGNVIITTHEGGETGIYLYRHGRDEPYDQCANNTISGNTFEGCEIGLHIEGASFNQFFNNTVSNYNRNGIRLEGVSIVNRAAGNIFYLNSIIPDSEPGSKVDVYIADTDFSAMTVLTNYWDSMLPVSYWYDGTEHTGCLGNYWGGYAGTDTDGDGIGDTAYQVRTSPGEFDNYPLVEQSGLYTQYAESPVAAFNSSVQSGDNPLTVQFTDLSTGTGPFTYEWDFDNNGTVDSTDRNPTYTYTTPGDYSVKLTVTSAYGSDSIVKTDYITVIPITASFYSRNPNYPNVNMVEEIAEYRIGHAPFSVTFRNNSTGSEPMTYEWDFDNNGTVDSTEENPTYIYTTPGTYTVSLAVTNATGSDTMTKTDYVEVIPAGPWIVDASGNGDFTTICMAVDLSLPYETIIVRDGTYNEQVRIYHPLTLRSENLHGATIQSPTYKCFSVGVWDVTIDGFNIVGNGQTPSYGIDAGNDNGAYINNNISEVFIGIDISTTNNYGPNRSPTIAGNNISLLDASAACGIYLKNAPHGTITGNNVTGPYGREDTIGICIFEHAQYWYVLYDHTLNTIYGNTCDSTGYGLWIRGATGNTVFDNTFRNNQYGVYMSDDAESLENTGNTFYLNSVIDSAVAPVLIGGDGVVTYNIWNSPNEITYRYNDTQYTGRMGNYWGSYYTGTDADGNGIGSPAYTIVTNEEADNFPLMAPGSDYSLTHIISASAGINGSIDPSGDVPVEAGTDQTFIITPDAGYRVQDILVDGQAVGAATTYTFLDVQFGHSISAGFVDANTFTIVASAGDNGTIGPSGYVTVSPGADQTFTITPAEGYFLATLTVDGVWVVDSDSLPELITTAYTYTFEDVDANHTISASFGQLYYSIRATAGPNGSISPSGGVQVDYGDNQSFTITPSTHYHIADVLVDGESVGAVSSYEFTNVTAEHAISASFEIDTFVITASAGTHGSIAPSGDVTVEYGANQAFTINPESGYHVAEVLVDGVSMGAVTSYTFINVTGGHTIAASFASNQTGGPVGGGGGGGTWTPPATTTTSPAPAPAPGVFSLAGLVDDSGRFPGDFLASSPDGGATITIQSDTVGYHSSGQPLNEITIAATDEPGVPGNFSLCGRVYDFGPDGAMFDPPVTITLCYDPALVTDDSSLAISWFDTASGQWVELAGTVDPVNHTVSAQVTHFTSFAVLEKSAPPSSLLTETTTTTPSAEGRVAEVTPPSSPVTTPPAAPSTQTTSTTAPANESTSQTSPDNWWILVGSITGFLLIASVVFLVRRRRMG